MTSLGLDGFTGDAAYVINTIEQSSYLNPAFEGLVRMVLSDGETSNTIHAMYSYLTVHGKS